MENGNRLPRVATYSSLPTLVANWWSNKRHALHWTCLLSHGTLVDRFNLRACWPSIVFKYVPSRLTANEPQRRILCAYLAVSFVSSHSHAKHARSCQACDSASRILWHGQGMEKVSLFCDLSHYPGRSNISTCMLYMVIIEIYACLVGTFLYFPATCSVFFSPSTLNEVSDRSAGRDSPS